jgi:hypothetical protein
MTSRLDQSSSRVNRGWIDEWGNKVRGSQQIPTYFLYHAPWGLPLGNLQPKGVRNNSEQGI